jgi:hypothetical protein
MWASGMELHSVTGVRGSQAGGRLPSRGHSTTVLAMSGFRPLRFILLVLALVATRLPGLEREVRSGGAMGYAPIHLAQCLVESTHKGSPSGDHDESSCPFWQSAGATVDQTPAPPALPGLSAVARTPRPTLIVVPVTRRFGGIPSTRSPPASLLG